LGLTQDVKALLIYRPRLRAARAAAAQVDAELLWQEWQVAGQARQLAVELIAREAERPLLAEAAALLERRDRVTRAALGAGHVTLASAAPAALGYQQARANLQALDQAQLQGRHQLDALLGLGPEVPIPLAESAALAPLDIAAVRAMLPDLAARRPDLLALRFGYRSQDETLRAAILSQFPDLVLGGAGTSDNSAAVAAGPSVTLALPVFDRNQGNIAIARATRAQLRAEYAARLAATAGEAGALLGEIEQLRAQLAVVEADLPQARLAASRASDAFAASLLDERSYVDLITNRFAKEQDVLALRLALLDRQVAIETLIGAGLPGVAESGLGDPGIAGAAR
ncbi:MAG: TolC family protein, partial [Sphingomonadales bacterium]|nr:TolC family protein [Sphingomonadales bacterium]